MSLKSRIPSDKSYSPHINTLIILTEASISTAWSAVESGDVSITVHPTFRHLNDIAIVVALVTEDTLDASIYSESFLIEPPIEQILIRKLLTGELSDRFVRRSQIWRNVIYAGDGSLISNIDCFDHNSKHMALATLQ